MIYDLLDVKENALSIEFKERNKFNEDVMNVKTVKLTDVDDNIYFRYRYKHISEAMQDITDEFAKFCQVNSKSQQAIKQLKAVNTEDMLNVLSSLPEYTELSNKYIMHQQILDKCYTLINEQSLKEVVQLEQLLSNSITKGSLLKEGTVTPFPSLLPRASHRRLPPRIAERLASKDTLPDALLSGQRGGQAPL